MLLGWMRRWPFHEAENRKFMIHSMKFRENALIEIKRSPAAGIPQQKLLRMGTHPQRWSAKKKNVAAVDVYTHNQSSE